MFLLLEVVFLPILIEQPALERHGWVEVALLRAHSLLILQHLLIDMTNNPQLMNIDLNLVLEALKCAQNRDAISNLHILISEPAPKVILSVASLAPGIVVVIQPQHAGHDAR